MCVCVVFVLCCVCVCARVYIYIYMCVCVCLVSHNPSGGPHSSQKSWTQEIVLWWRKAWETRQTGWSSCFSNAQCRGWPATTTLCAPILPASAQRLCRRGSSGGCLRHRGVHSIATAHRLYQHDKGNGCRGPCLCGDGDGGDASTPTGGRQHVQRRSGRRPVSVSAYLAPSSPHTPGPSTPATAHSKRTVIFRPCRRNDSTHHRCWATSSRKHTTTA